MRINIREQKTVLIIAVAVLVLASAIAFLALKNPDSDEQEFTGVAPTTSTIDPAIVTLQSSGFMPSTIKVKVNTPIKWTVSDSAGHQIVSDPHPSHSTLPDLESQTLQNKDSYVYTFKKVGTFTYHDETNPQMSGTVIVSE